MLVKMIERCWTYSHRPTSPMSSDRQSVLRSQKLYRQYLIRAASLQTGVAAYRHPGCLQLVPELISVALAPAFNRPLDRTMKDLPVYSAMI